jgi:hypothetical protein
MRAIFHLVVAAFALVLAGPANAVWFSNADFALISNLLQGIHGQPVEDRPGTPLVRVWRDQRRGSTISATPIGAGTQMDYLPANRPG